MLRRTSAMLKVSPYFLFLKDLSQAGKLKGVRAPGKVVAKEYKKLSPQKKALLVKRASAMTFPANEKYSRVLKAEMKKKNVPVAERQAAVKAKWSAMKKAQAPKSAKSKVKKAAKASKK